ncbi:MAG: hypothetical protein RL354_1735 [Planctomycetota bacterium]|jgi:hypothetical protein
MSNTTTASVSNPRPHTASPAVLAAIACTAFAAVAGRAAADFTGFGSNSYVVAGDLHTYHIVEVYATFDQPADRILNVYDVTARLANPSDPDAVATFFHADDPDSELPPSFQPLGYLPPGEAWRHDTYVTIGAEQGNMMNGTILDPSFVDSKFVQMSEISDNAGWYNIPPTNGFGVAGDDLKVLLGVFVVTGDSFAPGLRLEFGGTVGYVRNGQLTFASATRSIAYPTGATLDYVADDLDNDGNGDILFYNPLSRQVAGWLMQDLSRKSGAVLPDAVPAGYTVQGMGDLDGNASTDIVWRDAQGRFHAWLTNGLSITDKAPISVPLSSAWQCVAIGDVSGDGRGDVVLRNSSTGEVRVWLMEGFTKIVEGSVGSASGRVCEAIADFDGDGVQDLLWRAANGTASVWLMNGVETLAQENVGNVSGPVASSWAVAGAGDLNGDGKADVVWRHQAAGTVTAWLMNGTQRASGGVLHAGISPAWRIEALRDLDNDGKADVVWRNTQNGDINGWIMNGLTKSRGGFVRNANMQWSVLVP